MAKSKDIINQTYSLVSNVQDSIISLNETCLEYVSLMDIYNENYIYDASILKKRMKDAVRKAAPDEL